MLSPTTLMISRFLAGLIPRSSRKALSTWIGVVGDSMEPFIKNGEYVIIERTQVARNNEIVIAVVDGDVYVKRLQKAPVRRIIKLTSAHPPHLDIELKEEELDRLRIIGVIRGGLGWLK